MNEKFNRFEVQRDLKKGDQNISIFEIFEFDLGPFFVREIIRTVKLFRREHARSVQLGHQGGYFQRDAPKV